jgi:hypothetical protein
MCSVFIINFQITNGTSRNILKLCLALWMCKYILLQKSENAEMWQVWIKNTAKKS